MNVCFETFGCRLNKAEALQREAEFIAAGHKITQKHSDASLFVVRGCSVTANAQHDCERLIAHLKHKYPNVQLIVEGCLKYTNNRKITFAPNPDAIPTRTARAYLKVQDGCNGKCTFCIVPSFRGKSASIDYDAAMSKAAKFIEAGYHEIVVTGCNLTLYASQGKRLPDLIAGLSALSPDCRIRLGSIEPGECANDCIDIMAEHNNICRFLHLPIQSGANPVLIRMGRPYQLRDIENSISRAVKLMPNIGLGCDIMTGFPGETIADFSATKFLLSTMPFSNAHIFPYSERKGTLAVAYQNSVPKTERSSRAHILSKVIKEKRQSFAKRFVGKSVTVLVEKTDPPAGWTSEYLSCKFIGTAERKSLVNLHVTKAEDGVLTGKLI